MPEGKPRLRGTSHALAFAASLPLGLVLVLEAETGRARVAASIFAASVAAMFGASALYRLAIGGFEDRRWHPLVVPPLVLAALAALLGWPWRIRVVLHALWILVLCAFLFGSAHGR